MVEELTDNYCKELSVTMIPTHETILHHLQDYDQLVQFLKAMGDNKNAAQVFGKAK